MRHALPAALHIVLVLLGVAVATSGCLFPPVEVTDSSDDVDPQGPLPTSSPDPIDETSGFVRAHDDDTATGRIAQGASTPVVEPGAERHMFDLPGRVQELQLRFDWESETADLDLRLELFIAGESVWTTTASDGRTGDPDTPVLLVFTTDEVPELGSADGDMMLQMDVSAEAAVDTGYSLYGQWWYLRPA